MSNLNWGTVHHETTLFRGCKIMDCSGHGGIILSPSLLATHPYFEKIKNHDFSKFQLSSGSYAFEEDLDANIILSCLPQSILSKHYPACTSQAGYQHFIEDRLTAVKNAYPEIFTLITGFELTIFDSQALFQEHLKNQTGLLYRDGSFSGYNVPEGFIAILVRNAEKEDHGQFLIPKNVHEKIKYPVGRLGYMPLEPSLLDTPFSLDQWTPATRYKQPKADHFYISHTHKKKDAQGSIVALAYNYETQAKLCFEMAEDHYEKSGVREHGIQVDAMLEVIDQPFIIKSNMTAEQYMSR